jgi:hypothetical protein
LWTYGAVTSPYFEESKNRRKRRGVTAGDGKPQVGPPRMVGGAAEWIAGGTT